MHHISVFIIKDLGFIGEGVRGGEGGGDQIKRVE